MLQRAYLGGSPVPTEQSITSFVESFNTWVDVVQGQNENCRDVEVAVRHLVQELAHATPQLRPLPAEDLEPVIRSLSLLVTNSRSGGGISQTALVDGQESPQDNDIHGLLGKIFIHAWRTVFRIVGGYLGLRPPTIQEDNICVVFHSSSQTAVVRPWGTGFSMLVGPMSIR